MLDVFQMHTITIADKHFSILQPKGNSLNRILVTGGAGFIGHHLVSALVNSGHDVIIIDNLSTSNKDFLAEVGNGKGKVRLYREDVRNKETVSDIVKKERLDACIHLAAKTSIIDSFVRPNDTLEVNVMGTLAMLEACARNGVGSFVFASSAAVYGNPKALPISEEHALEPLSPYGASKAAGEMLVSSYVQAKKIRTGISLRLFNVYGEGQNIEYAGVIAKFSEQLSKGLQPVVYGDGTQTRDFIFIDDVVNALILAMDADPGVFNIGTGSATSITDLAYKMIREYGLTLQPLHYKSREGEILQSYANIEKALKLWGFRSRVKLDEGLRKLIHNTS
jgi:UDP-glucose 4-epimerase